ncbi:unnamed protein product [Effrenium voratum]|nr:unnamed protein product [Effrenium voratum]
MGDGSLPSDARVVQLEAALAEERRKIVQKDEEILQMKKLMAKLESHIEQQAKDSELEQSRLSSLETVLSQKHQAEESEKVKKLVLALAEVKRQKEAAEKLASEESQRATRLTKQVEELLMKVDNSSIAVASGSEEELQRLREDYATEQQKREDAEVRERMQRAKMEQLELQLADTAQRVDASTEDKASIAALEQMVAEKESRLQEVLQCLAEPGAGEVDVVVTELQDKLNCEEKKRRESESLVADRDGQLRHLRERLLGEEKERFDREMKLQQFETDLRDSKKDKSEVLTKLSAKESQLVELQRQLAEELTQRQAAQKQLVEKERMLKDLREEPLDRLSAQQAVQEQVIEKEREVCNLQQQLADELSKRQTVQYSIIEKDRLICELQSQLSEQGPGPEMDAALQPIEEDNTLSAPGTPAPAPKKLPPWLAARGSVPVSTPVGRTSDVWMSQGVYQQGNSYQPRMYPAGPQHPAPQPSPGIHYRARVYGVSPRQGLAPAHLSRRLAQGASTFT